MRDSFKSMDYYEKVYNYQCNLIADSYESLQSISEKKVADFENVAFCHRRLADDYFLRFYISYTMGKNFDELLPDVIEYIRNASEGWTGEDFETLVFICSLSVLFEVHNEFIGKLREKAEQRLNDCKYGELFLKLVEPTFEVKADKTYYADDKAIVEVIELAQTDKTTALKRLKKYVEKEWFKTLKEGLITNTSKCYRGYWCIEAAALVRALGLNDAELKDCKYYPYDMAHFCD